MNAFRGSSDKEKSEGGNAKVVLKVSRACVVVVPVEFGLEKRGVFIPPVDLQKKRLDKGLDV